MILVLLFVLALLCGGLGLFVKGAFWLLIVAVVLVVGAAIVGAVGRGRGPRV